MDVTWSETTKVRPLWTKHIEMHQPLNARPLAPLTAIPLAKHVDVQIRVGMPLVPAAHTSLFQVFPERLHIDYTSKHSSSTTVASRRMNCVTSRCRTNKARFGKRRRPKICTAMPGVLTQGCPHTHAYPAYVYVLMYAASSSGAQSKFRYHSVLANKTRCGRFERGEDRVDIDNEQVNTSLGREKR